MTSKQFHRRAAEALKAVLLQNIGVKQVVVEGQTIQFDNRDALLEQLEYHQRLARPRKPLFISI
ncbi:MAG TPA: hypothetical protein VF595_01095 [Tepidisphaeraceae bacterium]|jgi:hypothetical protein